jgi:hypothetical protein
MTGYRRMDLKINTGDRLELNIFYMGNKIKEYQRNYFEYILGMPTYRHSLSCTIIIPKEEEREIDHRRDGRISWSNPGIGTCQKA